MQKGEINWRARCMARPGAFRESSGSTQVSPRALPGCSQSCLCSAAPPPRGRAFSIAPTQMPPIPPSPLGAAAFPRELPCHVTLPRHALRCIFAAETWRGTRWGVVVTRVKAGQRCLSSVHGCPHPNSDCSDMPTCPGWAHSSPDRPGEEALGWAECPGLACPAGGTKGSLGP